MFVCFMKVCMFYDRYQSRPHPKQFFKSKTKSSNKRKCDCEI